MSFKSHSDLTRRVVKVSPERARRKIITGIAGFVAIVLGITVYVFISLGDHKKAKEATTSLHPEAIQLIRSGNLDHETLKMHPGLIDTMDISRLVVVRRSPFTDPTGTWYYLYDNKINKRLGTDAFLGGEPLNGIVAVNREREEVGSYDGIKKAFRQYDDIYFIKLPEQLILKHERIYGGEPPSSIRSSQTHGLGSAPSTREVEETIRRIAGIQ